MPAVARWSLIGATADGLPWGAGAGLPAADRWSFAGPVGVTVDGLPLDGDAAGGLPAVARWSLIGATADGLPWGVRGRCPGSPAGR